MEDVMNTGEDEVIGGREGHRGFGWEPSQRVTNACGTSFPQPNRVTTVRLESGSCVPTISTVRRPGGALAGLDVDEDTNAGWGQRRSIAIKVPVHLCVSGQLWVEARPT
ncbi:hypothetical protein MHU86_18992 [Fragilaria crotonensis]|nr:hypothetical protein MHU86_18992 [Fragilaria crotonensis]